MMEIDQHPDWSEEAHSAICDLVTKNAELEAEVERLQNAHDSLANTVTSALRDAMVSKAKLRAVEGLLSVAVCPNCDGSGDYHDADGTYRQQCQWCIEKEAALK